MLEDRKAADVDTAQISAEEFQRLVEPYQKELLVHCYRFFGSLDDAEDALQEALIRAWRRLDTLKEQTSLRAWLYKIATNVSLDMLDRRKIRSLPFQKYPSSDPDAPLPAPILDPIWLDPLPDEYLPDPGQTPEARYDTRESVALAFLALLQKLPGRQRAVLILRDVLGWKAQEVAEMLDLTVTAVNSALQRARETVRKGQSEEIFSLPLQRGSGQTAALLERYLQAWEAADLPGLAGLLREDAILTMPPLPAWFAGRRAIEQFYNRQLFTGPTQGQFRLIPTRANGCPAFAVYQQEAYGVNFRPASLQVVLTDGENIVQVHTFLAQDGRLFARFKLPISL